MIKKNCCKNCKHGRIDCTGNVFCSKFNSSFSEEKVCKLWEIKSEFKIETDSTKSGYVYILSNMDMPGLLKVGMTHRKPEIRALEISSATGVVSKYKIEYYCKVNDRFLAEKAAHNRLKNYHYKKEFFKTDIGIAIYCVETISVPVERIFIREGNEEKVINYALEKNKIPYKYIEKEYELRKNRQHDKQKNIEKYYSNPKNWDVKVNEYFQKLEKNPDLTKTENGYKENVNFKKFENDLKNANNNIEEKNKEIEKLKTELAKEKQKGFFKRLFS
jgi:hypothetical protein